MIALKLLIADQEVLDVEIKGTDLD